NDIRVCRESVHTLVNFPVLGSKPINPIPLVLPLTPSKVKSDCKNRPSWIIFWRHSPVLRAGSPERGKKIFSTSQSPTNRSRYFCPAPGPLRGSNDDCGSFAGGWASARANTRAVNAITAIRDNSRHMDVLHEISGLNMERVLDSNSRERALL